MLLHFRTCVGSDKVVEKMAFNTYIKFTRPVDEVDEHSFMIVSDIVMIIG